MGSSTGLEVGASVPDASQMLVEPGGVANETALSDLYAEQPVLLTFYTNDFTPDCMKEWCSFRDYDWFNSTDDVRVVGVSKSGVPTHRWFIDFLGLGFSLYSDAGLELTREFGVKYEAFKIAPRSRRSCFLIDTDGVVRYKWVGDHPIDPTRDQPPISEIHEVIMDEFGGSERETFGL